MNTNYDDKRGQSGYGSLLLVKEAGELKYSLLCPLETVPSVFGAPESFDYNFLSSATKGKIMGKEEMESKDVEFFWHRDNIIRLESLQGKVLDFLDYYQDFSARAFSGTLRVRPNDAGAEILKGTVTITPLSGTTTSLLDCRDLVKPTVRFLSTIPDKLTIGQTPSVVNLSVAPADGQITATSNNANFVATPTQGVTTPGAEALPIVSIAKGTTPGASPQYGVITITLSKTGYANWITTIAVEY